MRLSQSRLALLLAAALSFSALAQETEHDDAEARMAAVRALQEEDVTADALIRTLEAARRERGRAGRPFAWGPLGRNMLARVPAGVWINLGPTRSDPVFNIDAGPDGEIAGRIRTVVPHPSEPGVLFIATSGGGVWKTYDRGRSWEPLTDLVGSTSIGALAMDPQNPDVLYLGFGDPFDAPQPGLTRSTDGASWPYPIIYPTATYGGTSFPAQRTRDIQVDPENSGHVLVATDVGLFKWDGVSAPVQLTLPTPGLVVGAVAPWSIVWVGPGTWLVSGQRFDLAPGATATQGLLGLWRSTDAGETWIDVAPGLPSADLGDLSRATLAVAPSTTRSGATSRVFLLGANAQPGAARAQKDLYRSEDGGRTWTPLRMNSSRAPENPIRFQSDLDLLSFQANYNQAIAVDPEDANTVFVGGQFAVARSRDSGHTWALIAEWEPGFTASGLSYVHADLHALAFGLAGGKTLYAGGDGGLFASTDSGAAAVHFSDQLNLGVVTHLVYHLACAPDTPGWQSSQDFVIAGLQDNGTRLRDSTSPTPGTFDQVLGGDGIGVAVSSAASGGMPLAVLASQPLHAIKRSVRAGAVGSWSLFMAGLPPADSEPIPFFIRLASDEAAPDGQTFLTFTNRPDRRVYRSIAGGAWAPINGSAIHNPDGSTGATFRDYAGTPVDFHLLATHQNQSGVYAVSASAGAVFVTPDAGSSWWGSAILGTNPQQRGLGLKSTTGVAFDPSDPTGSRYWAASEATTAFDTDRAKAQNPPTRPVPDSLGHLFRTDDRGQTWRPVHGSGSDVLPNVPIASIKADPNDPATLYVGTYVGLYVTQDSGQTFKRPAGLPLVKVTDICVAPGSSNMKIATYGRGIWQLNLGPGGAYAGARGRGDVEYDQQLDGFDLIKLTGALGTTNASAAYLPEADLVGSTNAVDDEDLKAFLLRFGGRP